MEFLKALLNLIFLLFVLALASLPILVGFVAGFICMSLRVGWEWSDRLFDTLSKSNKVEVGD